jgi:mannose/fructose/N-acetylgalactosamine-specific phosphotransferase system component IIC
MRTALLILELLIIPGLITTVLVSIAARYIEQQELSKFEFLISFLLWPYFLIALIVHLNTPKE